MNKSNRTLTATIILGTVTGAEIGVATENIALWIGVGIAIGAGIGASLNRGE